jgi:hypothetical protein
MNTLLSIRRLSSVLLTVAFALLVFTACDSLGDFGDTNTDPTEASTINPDLEFSTVQLGTAGSRWEVWRTNLIYNELIVQHLGTNLGYWVGDDYGLSSGYASSFFEASYDGGVNGVGWLAAVKNVENLIARLQEDGEVPSQHVNRVAAARIWRVLIYQRITDTYGDIPYREAGKGYLEGEFTPRYTPQDSIYMDMKSELQAAIDQFDASQPTYGSADLVYGGDINKWKKFANSLQLRLALRIVKVNPSMAESWATEAINGGVMESNADMAYINHQSGPSTGPVGFNSNANSEVYAFGAPRISQAMVDFMQSRDDPRLLTYGAREVDGQVISDPDTIKGWPNGYTATTIDQHPSWTGNYNQYLALNPALRDLDDPFFFQTYAEVEFMLAEAAARGWTGASAENHFEAGVRAAMNYLSLYGESANISSAEIDDYLAENPYNAGAPLADRLDQINTQYWAATLLNGFEAWANWRRSGYPELDPAPVDNPNQGAGSYTEGVIMRRLIYPPNEVSLNPESYEAARSRQGITDQNQLTKPMWWDCGDLADQCNTTGLGPQADPTDPSNGPGDAPAD